MAKSIHSFPELWMGLQARYDPEVATDRIGSRLNDVRTLGDS